jgi:hypothetical protein
VQLVWTEGKMTDPEKVPGIPFYRLVGSGIDLASAFKSAVDAFNARDLTTLMNLCDEGVVVSSTRLRDHHCGKSAVSAYFADRFRINKPTFTPTTTHTTINPGCTVGHIIGAADWTEFDPSDPPGEYVDGILRYAFNFISRGNGWLISTLWTSPDRFGLQS